MQRLLLATTNTSKIREMQAILGDIPFELISPKDINLELTVDEPFATYVENASQKAREYCLATGLPVLADDSGLEIDGIPDELGVYSARYGSNSMTYPERFQRIESQLAGLPEDAYAARYRCVLALGLPPGFHIGPSTPDEVSIILTDGTVEGVISFPPRGTNGFGYDPIFYLPTLQCTMAELKTEMKNDISHRTLAARQMKHILLAISQQDA